MIRTADDMADELLKIFREWQSSGTPLSRDYLRKRLGCSDRVLRKAIVHLRKRGELIIAERSGGYRLALHEGEVAAYTASLKRRIAALRDVVEAMESAAQDRFGCVPSQPALL